jgi:hypothetical protein
LFFIVSFKTHVSQAYVTVGLLILRYSVCCIKQSKYEMRSSMGRIRCHVTSNASVQNDRVAKVKN